MRAYSMLPAGPNVLPGLDEFVVTEKKPAATELPKMYLPTWFNSLPDWPTYILTTNPKQIKIKAVKPTDVEVVYEDYDIIWDWNGL